MKKFLVALLVVIGLSFSTRSIYSQCGTGIYPVPGCNGLVTFYFESPFFSPWNVVACNEDFGDFTTGNDSLVLDSINWAVLHTYTANGAYTSTFIITYYDTLVPGSTCTDTISAIVDITNAGSPPSTCSITFSQIQYCMDSIYFAPDSFSYPCGYSLELVNAVTNYGDTLWSHYTAITSPMAGFTLSSATSPWPDSMSVNYEYLYLGNPMLVCTTTVLTSPLNLFQFQMDLFADTNSMPVIIVNDTSVTNMFLYDVNWGDGAGQTYIHANSATHQYILDGTYQIIASAIPQPLYIYYSDNSFDSVGVCIRHDTTLVEIRGVSNSLSCNLEPVVNYLGATQELEFYLYDAFYSQYVFSSNLDVSWNFSNGMNSTLDGGSFSGVSPGPVSFTVTYTIYDFWGNPQCTNTISNTVNTIYPSCNALVFIYEDSLVPGLYWAVDQSIGGLAPYSYLWDFGDGTTSNLQYPMHTYSPPGAYTVCLTITDSQVPPCISTYCQDSVGLAPFNSVEDRASNPVSQINVYNPFAIGLEDNISNEFNLFPNPVSDYIILNAGENYGNEFKVSIYNVAGQILTSKKYPNAGNITISVEDWSTGVYFLKVEDGLKSMTRKFIRK